MKQLPVWFRLFVRVLGTIAPPLMTRVAWKLFWDLGTPTPLREDARDVQNRASRETASVNGHEAVLYRWGTGPSPVLLVHGWQGRASQFAAIIRGLESPDRTIFAFDAPGNGDAPGDRTDIFDYIAVIRRVYDEVGAFEVVVGHSFGVLALFSAIRAGVKTDRIVSIAGVSGFNYVVSAFATALDLPIGVIRRLRRRIERDIFAGDTTFWRTWVSELEPTNETPLFVIQDRYDRAVDFRQSALIAEAQVGPLTELYTSGLGHSRVLSDTSVVESIVRFTESTERTRSTAGSREIR